MTNSYGFELIRTQDIPELNTRGRLYRHVKTGAELLSLENDDENKVFGITFRTPPADSTGVAHILEHSVLCGSRKYPLKEPFVELLKGSLKTFLNAFTFPDKTCYPVASQNLQDFYNLIDVYLDAVFYPRLTPAIFQQEGWHYELEAADAPLTFKGVVFNEMKGAYASPERVLSDHSRRSLFPDITYGVSSGGEPQHILDLTYEQLSTFHRQLYHPSNARIFFWGDDPPEERLRLLDNYLKAFDRIAVDSSVALQPPFDTPQRFEHAYVVDPEEAGDNKSMLTLNWMLTETDDPETILALEILSYILVSTPASPLRKALIDSGLGEDIAGGGMDDSLRQAYFSTGLKGIAVANADTIEALILQTLEGLARDGIDPQMVEAAVNTIEFRLREQNTGSAPRGLWLMINALITWLHDRDPFAILAFAGPLEAIKGRLAAGERYFERLIKRYLLENSHRTTILLQPDPELGQREAAAEQARLDAARAAMGPAEIQAVVENTRELKRLQETPDPPEALATIPTLTLADLERQNKTIPLEVDEAAGSRVLYHDLFTNGIVYLDVGLNLHMLPPELLPYVKLFGRALLEMGTEQEDFVKLSQRIGRQTGGIVTSSFTSVVPGDPTSAAWLFLRGKATPEHAADLLAILRDVLLTVHFDDHARFRQIVLEAKARAEAGIIPSGHAVVDTRLRARFNESDWADEQMSGINYLFFLRDLAMKVDREWPVVLSNLEVIRRLLVNRAAMICNVTADAGDWAQFRPQLNRFLAELPTAPVTLSPWTPQFDRAFEGLTIPANVNYVGKGADLYQLGYRYHGSTSVITKYLRTTWLWEKVRMQGGAYGSFCSFDRQSGVLSFLSYRDPNLRGTLDVYDQAGRFLRAADLNETEVTRAIIGAIGDLDAYRLPDAKGYSSMVRYLVGDTDEARQQMRDEILATQAGDFHAFADWLEQVREQGQVVVLGGQNAIEALNAEHPGQLKTVRVL